MSTPEPELNVEAEIDRIFAKECAFLLEEGYDLDPLKQHWLALIQQVSDQRVRAFSDKLKNKFYDTGYDRVQSDIDQTLKEYLDHE